MGLVSGPILLGSSGGTQFCWVMHQDSLALGPVFGPNFVGFRH